MLLSMSCLLPVHLLKFFHLGLIPSKCHIQICLAVRTFICWKDAGVCDGVWVGYVQDLEIHLHGSSPFIPPNFESDLPWWNDWCIGIQSTQSAWDNWPLSGACKKCLYCYLSFWSSSCLTFACRSGIYAMGALRTSSPPLSNKKVKGTSSEARFGPTRECAADRTLPSVLKLMFQDFIHLHQVCRRWIPMTTNPHL